MDPAPVSLVGIIANPSAGKDIRRLVAHGRVVPNHEKVNIIRRVLLALDAVGVERVLFMPDPSGLGARAIQEIELALEPELLQLSVRGEESDSTRAAAMMAERGAGCIVTLGGDGTNRAVALGSGSVPLMPISTGTNNVFPAMVEGTTAGLAAGLVACGLVAGDAACPVQKRFDVLVDGELEDIALIDVAVSSERFVGARAIWDLDTVDELFLACAEPSAIGLSAIGAQLHPIAREDPDGLYLRLGGEGTAVLAAVAPGSVQRVAVAEWWPIAAGERLAVRPGAGTIALDGERQLASAGRGRIEVVLNPAGPRVVALDVVLAEAARRGLFVGGQAPGGAR